MNEFLKDNERLDDLLNGLKIIQHREKYAFTSDAVLLAGFAKVAKGMRIADIGAGSGIISMLLVKKAALTKVYAVEMQDYMADMCKRSVEMNGLSDVIKVIHGKIQDSLEFLGKGNLDVIVTNPPYQKAGSCQRNESEEIALSRHDNLLPLDELLFCCSKLLKFSGKLYIIYPSNRLAELIETMHAHKIEPKRLQLIAPKAGKAPDLALVEGIRGGKLGLKVLPQLVRNEMKNGK